MQDVLNLLESQGYREGGILRFEGGGRPDVREKEPAPTESAPKKEPFVEPDWVATAPKVIGTGVEPVYPTKTVGGRGGDRVMEDRSANPIGYRFDNGKSQYVYLDLNGKVTNIQNRGNFVDDITSFAAMVPGPWQPFAQGYRAIKAIDKGDIVGGAATLTGLGGYSDVAQYLKAAKALESKDPLAILSATGTLTGNQDLKDLSKGINTAKDLSKGDFTGVINAVGNYTDNQDIKDAGSMLQVVNTIKKALSTGVKLPSAVTSLLSSGLSPDSKEVIDAFLQTTKTPDTVSTLLSTGAQNQTPPSLLSYLAPVMGDPTEKTSEIPEPFDLADPNFYTYAPRKPTVKSA